MIVFLIIAVVCLCALYAFVQYVQKEPAKQKQLGTNVNIGSFLNIEDFFNESEQKPNETENVSGGLQGKTLHPVILEPLAQNFSSEGHLVKILSETNRQPVETITTFRQSFVRDEDFAFMQNSGVKKVRLPVGWWIFAFSAAGSSVEGQLETSVLVTDPYSNGQVQQVCGTRCLLEGFLRRAKAHNLTVLIDLHALQGGSSRGSYNGVSGIIHEPVFWNKEVVPEGFNPSHFVDHPEEYTQAHGLKTWVDILRWVKGLGPELAGTVSGVCPMNEPAHLLPQYREKMLSWLAAAVQVYRHFFYDQQTAQFQPNAPRLYVNLIETTWKDSTTEFEEDAANFMHTHCQGIPKDLVSLDVHKYIAWDDRTNTPPSSLVQNVEPAFAEYVATVARRKALCQDKYGLAVSEWSAAWTNISSSAVQFPEYRKLAGKLFKYQVETFGQDMELFFWSLKMPGGHTHRPFWSLEYLSKEIL